MTVKEQGKLFQGGSTMESINNVEEQCFTQFEKESKVCGGPIIFEFLWAFCKQKLRMYDSYKLRREKPPVDEKRLLVPFEK